MKTSLTSNQKWTLTVLIFPLLFLSYNINNKLETVGKNSKQIEKLDKKYNELKDLIQENQIKVIEAVSRVEILIEKRTKKENSKAP